MDQTSDSCFKSIQMVLFVHYSLIPAVLITLILSYLQRQAKHKKSIDKVPLGKRFGIVVPVNFISSYSNRWSYGAACGATATTVFQLFFNKYSDYFNFTAPTWAKALVYLLCALEVGLDYYPFFACLSTENRLIGSSLGFCYSLCWFCVQLADLFECQTKSEVSEDSLILILTPVPSLVCCLFLMGRFLQILVRSALSLYRQVERKEEEEPLLPEHLTNYVRHLLKMQPKLDVQIPSRKWKIYVWDQYFKFPTRIIVTAVLGLICLYNFVLVDLLFSTRAVLVLDSWTLNTVNVSFSNQTKRVLLLLKECWFYSTFPSAFTSVIYILYLLFSYRKEIRKLYKGASDIPIKGKPPVVLAASIKYTGNQIAYLLWGYFLLHIMTFLISLIITFCFVFPVQEGKGMVVLQAFGYIVLGIVLVVAVAIAQVLIVQFLFLQDKVSSTDKSKPLAINNRRGFQNFSYFFMFYSAVLGLGTCLIRIIFNVFLGCWSLARIDRPLFPRGYEGADMDLVQDARKKQIRTKWHLYYTLINNPALILNRKQTTFDFPSQSQDALRSLLISVLCSHGRKWLMTERITEKPTDTTIHLSTAFKGYLKETIQHNASD